MRRGRLLLLLTFIYGFCVSSSTNPSTVILVETRLGSIKIKLYDDTPLHKANFLKLIKSGYYDSLLFHRVIKDFMIQGGDPNSKHAVAGMVLGEGDAGYTLPAEILPNHFHYRGALAAAREGDQVNPTRRSSGAQFYIVQGKKFTESELSQLQIKLNQRNLQMLTAQINTQLSDSISHLSLNLSPDSIKAIAKQKAVKLYKSIIFTEAQVKTYREIGGAPHLDGAYTIFGEVIEGLDVVEKISLLPTDSNNRPLEDLRMNIKIIN
jgi:peptidylprolyl isomerase